MARPWCRPRFMASSRQGFGMAAPDFGKGARTAGAGSRWVVASRSPPQPLAMQTFQHENILVVRELA